MKVNIIGKNTLKKAKLQIVKIATIGLALVTSLTACTNTNFIKNNENNIIISYEDKYDTTNNQNTSSSDNQIDYDNTTNEQENHQNETGVEVEENVNEFRDVSEDYGYLYIGPNDGGTIIASPENFLQYKDTDNAFTRNASNFVNQEVSMSHSSYINFTNELNSMKVDIPYSDLFNLEHLTERDKNEEENHAYSFKLTNGHVDASILYQVVQANNKNYGKSHYINLNNSELKEITNIITDTINYHIDNNEYIDIDSLVCNLGSLKIFGENDISNARITYDNVLAISHDMIQELQKNVGSGVDAFKLTIAHEANHILQLNCDDEINKAEGNIIGFNRKWTDEPINSLFWNWYYEASAETLMTNKHQTDNLVYENQTNYLKYLKLALCLDPNFDITSLEEVSVSRSRDDFYALFGAKTEEDKLAIAKIMYAIELIQNENDDFEKIYIEYTNQNKHYLSTEEWINIKRELKSAIAINLSIMFYENLAQLVQAGSVTLNDVYYLITVFEAEIESHNTYDSLNRFEANKPFMERYIQIQDIFFNYIESSYLPEEMINGFNTFSFKDDYDTSYIHSDTSKFINCRQNELISNTTTNIRMFYNVLLNQYENSRTLTLS